MVLNGHAPPNVRQPGRKLEIVLEHLLHSLGALRKDLVGVPVGGGHHLEGCDDELIGNVVVEQIRHAVNEDPLWTRPPKRLKQLPRRKANVKSLLERVAGDTANPFREYLGIAVRTTWTDFCTPANRVPRIVCPFNQRRLSP